MIQVRERHDGELAVLGELAQQQRQRDRVGAAGEPDEHTGPRRTQRVPADRAANLLMETCQVPIL